MDSPCKIYILTSKYVNAGDCRRASMHMHRNEDRAFGSYCMTSFSARAFARPFFMLFFRGQTAPFFFLPACFLADVGRFFFFGCPFSQPVIFVVSCLPISLFFYLFVNGNEYIKIVNVYVFQIFIAYGTSKTCRRQ